MLKQASIAIPALLLGTLFGATVTRSTAQQSRGEVKKVSGQFPNLQQGILETPGCLGVSTAVVGGKQTIFAWFQNKASVQAWYDSPMHRGAMAKFFPGFKPKGEVLPQFKDDKAPIMMVASLTPGGKTEINGSTLAVSQIAIEAYTPVPGGIAYGGTFAPDKLAVPGLFKIPSKGN